MISPASTSVGKVLRRLGFARLSVRPKYPSSRPEAQDAFLARLGQEALPEHAGDRRAADLDPVRAGPDPGRAGLVPDEPGQVGGAGAQSRAAAAAQPARRGRVERFGWVFGPGGKVMQVANDDKKEVFNGDLGLVQRVDGEAGSMARRRGTGILTANGHFLYHEISRSRPTGPHGGPARLSRIIPPWKQQQNVFSQPHPPGHERRHDGCFWLYNVE
jgi:hypothetical protein